MIDIFGHMVGSSPPRVAPVWRPGGETLAAGFGPPLAPSLPRRRRTTLPGKAHRRWWRRGSSSSRSEAVGAGRRCFALVRGAAAGPGGGVARAWWRRGGLLGAARARCCGGGQVWARPDLAVPRARAARSASSAGAEASAAACNVVVGLAAGARGGGARWPSSSRGSPVPAPGRRRAVRDGASGECSWLRVRAGFALLVDGWAGCRWFPRDELRRAPW